MLSEKDFVATSSFDSSDEDAPQPLKSSSTFSTGVATRNFGAGYAINLSQSQELNARSLPERTAFSLKASEDVKSLFQFIGSYKPREVEIGTILRPFIPDYIPAVGFVDEFIKVPRPDGLPDYLGLKVLDESGSVQSDPAVVALQLRASSMQSSHHTMEVATIEEREKNPRKIDAWIESMKDLHRSKPPSLVTYSKPMPDMEKLIKELLDVEKALSEMQLLDTQEDMDLPTFVDVCCSFLGIPVYNSRIESLHCMFALLLELKKQSGCR